MWTNYNNKEVSQNWFHQVLLERKVNSSIFLKQHSIYSPKKIKLGQNHFLELDPKEMTAFILHFKQNHPQSEIATILGLSPESLQHLFSGLTTKLQAYNQNSDKPYISKI